MRTLLAGLLVGVLLGLAGVGLGIRWAQARAPEAARTGVAPQSIRVTGAARISAEHEVFRIRLSLQKQGKTVAEAERQVSGIARAVTAAVQRLGVKPEQVVLDQFSVDQQWDYAKNTPRAYNVQGTLTIALQDPQQLGRVLDAALAQGPMRVQGVTHEPSQAEWREQAVEAALQQAQAKAEALAKGMSKRLGRVVSVQERDDSPPDAADDARAARWASYSYSPFSSVMPPTYPLRGRSGEWVYLVVEYEM